MSTEEQDRPVALVVEDSPAIAERIVLMLEEMGYNIEGPHATEDEALKACDTKPYALAVVDLQLAQGTGFGVVRRLAALNRSGPHQCCVAVFTGYAVPALKVASYEAGADYFLDKADFNSVAKLAAVLLGSLQGAAR